VRGTPAGLLLAAATLRFTGVEPMRGWLEDTAEEGGNAAAGLWNLLVENAPDSLLTALATVDAAGELDATRVTHELLWGGARAVPDFALARRLHLLEERHGLLRLTPYVRSLGKIPRTPRVHDLLERVATMTLDAVNDRSSLRPKTARDVLDAHRMQLAIGDFDGALTTARLHVGGLVAHARKLGVAARQPAEFEQARRAYADILRQSDEGRCRVSPRVLAYVQHYRGYNGHRAKTMGLDLVEKDYEAAVEGFRVNALFHARRIALAAERGEIPLARELLTKARRDVPEHDRKEAYLSVRTAQFAHWGGAPLFALELLDDFDMDSSELFDVDPVASTYLDRLTHGWSAGIEVEALPVPDGRELVFTGPIRVVVRERGEGWLAETQYPPARAAATGPFAALRALTTSLADEVVRLVSAPTGRLPRNEVGKKGLYLGAVNLARSELGLPFHDHRWLVGRLEDGKFVPNHPDLVEMDLPADLQPECSTGLLLVRVSVGRGGLPSGRPERVELAGSGSMEAVLEALNRVVGSDAA